jgi:hypothetical protein
MADVGLSQNTASQQKGKQEKQPRNQWEKRVENGPLFL